jgi:hypothetical protein
MIALNDTRLPARFWSKVACAESGCWEWTGSKHRKGYGTYWDGKTRLAHRYSYRALVGEIPGDRQIDHLCKNTKCVNPAHLDVVTPAENIRRSGVAAARRRICAAVTHCPHGHEYTPENTRISPKRPNDRSCRECHRISSRKRMRRKLEEKSGRPVVPRVKEPQ